MTEARRAARASGLRTFAVALAVAATGCAATPLTLDTARVPPRAITTPVTLHGTPMELHISAPATPTSPTIVVYATDDGGWFGTAVDMFRTVAAHGYRVVGFSARAFLRIELAAADPLLSERTRGVVAIGLAADEGLKVDEDASDDAPDPDGLTADPREFDTYAQVRRLAPIRCAVIQAAHDDYLPAAQARILFGPDTGDRCLYEVPARNHRVSGGRDALVATLTDALSWSDGVVPAAN